MATSNFSCCISYHVLVTCNSAGPTFLVVLYNCCSCTEIMIFFFRHYAASCSLATVDIAEIAAWRQGAQCKQTTQMLTLLFARALCKPVLLAELMLPNLNIDLFALMTSPQDLLHDCEIVRWLVNWCSLNINIQFMLILARYKGTWVV